MCQRKVITTKEHESDGHVRGGLRSAAYRNQAPVEWTAFDYLNQNVKEEAESTQPYGMDCVRILLQRMCRHGDERGLGEETITAHFLLSAMGLGDRKNHCPFFLSSSCSQT